MPSVAEQLIADNERNIKLVQRDMPRTFGNHPLFQDGAAGTQKTYDVLEAYTCYRPDLGYVQGKEFSQSVSMSYLAAILCLHLDSFGAFRAMVSLMSTRLMFDMYRLEEDRTFLYLTVYDTVLKHELPTLYSHFQEIGMDPKMKRRAFTLFTRCVPLEVVLRIWDCYIYLGTPFFFQACMAILVMYEDTLLTLDLGDAMKFLHNVPKVRSILDSHTCMTAQPCSHHPLSVPDKVMMGTKPLPAYTSSSSPDMLPPPPPPPLEDYSPESPTCGYGIGFTDQYKLGETLGTGNFSVVREALHKPSGQRYAIKCIKKGGLSNDDHMHPHSYSFCIWLQMKHPNIMILHDFFSEPDYYYLVTEYMDGGELFDRVVEKPENLLLTSKMDDASIKLADFGFAKRVDMHDEGLKTACGTPGYVAPEILESRPYGKSVDIWSIGVITYILLCGYPPFHDDNHHALFRKIKQGQFEFDAPYWDAISDDAKHFIGQMLVVDNKLRATAAQLLEHPWIVGSQVSTVQLSSALDELRRFTARDKFKGAVRAVVY
ncbi:hypothetical protein DYB30_004528 [Aphanomyces astaci]|uniref:Protein kinase domain-containing protein n=1 Tax=Aphanomyces astaci TaxID=112090 RepID=A0A397DFG8_APHAT|nr:hypothetical protein DYB30_004528 [Aphanomyces astaci]